MRCGTIGSCQSAATSEIVKALLEPGHESDWCKRRYNKCPDLYLYLSCHVGNLESVISSPRGLSGVPTELLFYNICGKENIPVNNLPNVVRL